MDKPSNELFKWLAIIKLSEFFVSIMRTIQYQRHDTRLDCKNDKKRLSFHKFCISGRLVISPEYP